MSPQQRFGQHQVVFAPHPDFNRPTATFDLREHTLMGQLQEATAVRARNLAMEQGIELQQAHERARADVLAAMATTPIGTPIPVTLPAVNDGLLATVQAVIAAVAPVPAAVIGGGGKALARVALSVPIIKSMMVGATYNLTSSQKGFSHGIENYH